MHLNKKSEGGYLLVVFLPRLSLLFLFFLLLLLPLLLQLLLLFQVRYDVIYERVCGFMSVPDGLCMRGLYMRRPFFEGYYENI